MTVPGRVAAAQGTLAAYAGWALHQYRSAVMTRLPPIPPENQPPKARDLHEDATAPKEAGTKATNRNADKKRQANISQNTHHQGYQQDR
jgi:hypothetical protein